MIFQNDSIFGEMGCKVSSALYGADDDKTVNYRARKTVGQDSRTVYAAFRRRVQHITHRDRSKGHNMLLTVSPMATQSPKRKMLRAVRPKTLFSSLP